VAQLLHDLQLSVLVALVLVHFFDGDGLARFHDLGLVDDAEGAAAKDAFRVVGEGGLLRRGVT